MKDEGCRMSFRTRGHGCVPRRVWGCHTPARHVSSRPHRLSRDPALVSVAHARAKISLQRQTLSCLPLETWLQCLFVELRYKAGGGEPAGGVWEETQCQDFGKGNPNWTSPGLLNPDVASAELASVFERGDVRGINGTWPIRASMPEPGSILWWKTLSGSLRTGRALGPSASAGWGAWSVLASFTPASHPEMLCKFCLQKGDTGPPVTKQRCESSGFVFPKALWIVSEPSLKQDSNEDAGGERYMISAGLYGSNCRITRIWLCSKVSLT